MVDLTIAVATYKGPQLLADCLQAIYRSPPTCNWELLVIDGEPVTSPLLYGRRLYVPPQGNIDAMNHAFQEARGEWVLFVADDVRLDPGAIEALWSQRSYFDVLQPVLWQPDGQIDNVGLRWRWPGYGTRIRSLGGLRATDAFAATCFLLYRKLWETVGPFDTQLGLSHEDVDWSLRLRRQVGGCCRFVPTAHATHLMGQTIGRVTHGELSPKYHRARLRIIEKHYGGLDRWLRQSLVRLLDALAARVRRG